MAVGTGVVEWRLGPAAGEVAAAGRRGLGPADCEYAGAGTGFAAVPES